MTISSKNLIVTAGVALMALVSLALPLSFIQASEEGYSFDYSYPMDSGYSDTGYSYDYSYPMDSGCSYSCGSSSGFSSGSSFGSAFSPFRMPTFSSANAAARSQVAATLPSFAQPQVTNIETCSAVNSCNVDNSYTDNSSYSVVDNSVYSVPTSYNTPITIAQDDHSAKVIYADEDDRDRDYEEEYYYQPRPPVYQPPYPQYPPVAYNPAPYVTLSSVPYTGLDLGPMGEALYWAFLVAWCALLAYLIVYKRVQNKVVGFLNSFLFGSATVATGTVAHANVAPKARAVEVKTSIVDNSVDPFIASQIKR